jgi:hypothetical protein
MGAAEKIDLAGKDWLTVEEAAHYCGVSDSQFRKNANAYGLVAKRFMGKQLYAKSDLYAAINGAESWLTSSPSIGEVRAHTSIGARAVNDSGGASANLQPVRLRKFVPRKKRS